MQYRLLVLATAVALVAGCSGPDPTTPAEKGQALMHAGNYDEAIEKLSDAIRLSPRDSEAYLNRGRAYQFRNNAGDLDAAVADFTTAIELAPDDPEPLYSRAIAYRDRSKATGSTEDAEQAQADQIAARELDASFEQNLAKMPSSVPEFEIDMRPPPGGVEKSAEGEDQPAESVDDAVRRIESAAAAAGREELREPGRSDDPRGRPSSRLPSRNDRDGGRAEDDQTSRYNRSKERNDAESEMLRRAHEQFRARRQSGTSTLPSLGPSYRAPAGSPFGGTTNIPGSPMTPRANAGSPRSLGGTLPPVGNSPFSRPAPYASPVPGAEGASPYQSPYSSRVPRPTGRVSQPLQTQVPAPPQSINAPTLPRTQLPPSFDRFDFKYNP